MAFAGKQPSASIHERSVRRSQVLDEVLAIMTDDSRMPSRNLGFGIVLIQINIREDAAVRVPPPDIGFDADYGKLSSCSPAALDNQSCQRARPINFGQRGAVRVKLVCLGRRRKSEGLERWRRQGMIGSPLIRLEGRA